MTSLAHRSFVHFDCVRVSAEVHRMLSDGEGSPGTERHCYRIPQAVLLRESVVEQPGTPPRRGPGTSSTSQDRVHGHRVGSLVGDVKLPGVCEVHPEGQIKPPPSPPALPGVEPRTFQRVYRSYRNCGRIPWCCRRRTWVRADDRTRCTQARRGSARTHPGAYTVGRAAPYPGCRSLPSIPSCARRSPAGPRSPRRAPWCWRTPRHHAVPDPAAMSLPCSPTRLK